MMDADDIDGLAGEYVLGSLDPIERAEVSARRKTDPALDGAIKAWEARLGPLSSALPGVEPPRRVFHDVLRRVQETARASKRASPRNERAERWIPLAVGGSALAACLAAVLVWSLETPARMPAKFIAELKKSVYPSDGTIAPMVPLGFEVYFDLRASTMLVRPFAVPPGSSRDYQLWLMPHGSAPPISLGVIPLAEATTSPWQATYSPRDLGHATLAVSLEPEGGSRKGIPTGPMVFVGKLTQAM